jgi:hypothetical protein
MPRTFFENPQMSFRAHVAYYTTSFGSLPLLDAIEAFDETSKQTSWESIMTRCRGPPNSPVNRFNIDRRSHSPGPSSEKERHMFSIQLCRIGFVGHVKTSGKGLGVPSLVFVGCKASRCSGRYCDATLADRRRSHRPSRKPRQKW